VSIIGFDPRFFPEVLQSKARAMGSEVSAHLEKLRSKKCAGAEWTGWFDWPREHGFELAKQISDYTSNLDVYCDTVLTIGIGGSYLGTRAVADALSHPYAAFMGRSGRNPRRPLMIYAGHHVSEASLVEVLDLLEERQPIVNVISKSGTTTEPAVAFRVIRAYMEKRFGKAEAARRIVATTDRKKGALRRLADEAGYKTFEVPDDVGGRYSVLTAVGLVPLALGGFDIQKLLQGADDMFASLRHGEAQDHPALAYAAYRKAAFDAGYRVELMAYAEPRLANIIEWWKQLFGESEGKSGMGLLPAGLSYTTDLHSLGQYVQDGVRNLIETFLTIEEPPLAESLGVHAVERRLRVPHAADNTDELGYLEGRLIGEVNQAAMQATKVAHFDGGVPCLSLTLSRLDEEGLGGLFAFFETACALGGALLGVNPFDQPGVEAYKRNLFGLLGKPGFESLGAEVRRRL
jgi:glucose-6-phosphate isomerase